MATILPNDFGIHVSKKGYCRGDYLRFYNLDASSPHLKKMCGILADKVEFTSKKQKMRVKFKTNKKSTASPGFKVVIKGKSEGRSDHLKSLPILFKMKMIMLKFYFISVV